MTTYTLQQLQDFLPEFIEEEFPKGKPTRFGATVAITLYTLWLNKNK
jgi:hypothetical protein